MNEAVAFRFISAQLQKVSFWYHWLAPLEDQSSANVSGHIVSASAYITVADMRKCLDAPSKVNTVEGTEESQESKHLRRERVNKWKWTKIAWIRFSRQKNSNKA